MAIDSFVCPGVAWTDPNLLQPGQSLSDIPIQLKGDLVLFAVIACPPGWYFACNGAHSLKQRLARWLLMMRDRSDEDALPITQSLLAEMLGVQRPTITNAARELERAGLITRGRRQVTILDRQGLTEESCECYQLVKTRVIFHLPKTYT